MANISKTLKREMNYSTSFQKKMNLNNALWWTEFQKLNSQSVEKSQSNDNYNSSNLPDKPKNKPFYSLKPKPFRQEEPHTIFKSTILDVSGKPFEITIKHIVSYPTETTSTHLNHNKNSEESFSEAQMSKKLSSQRRAFMSASALRRENVEISNHQINHTYNQNFAGYLAYWKLILQFYPIAKASINLNAEGHFTKKIIPWMVVILKTPWGAFVKPLGCVFSYAQNLHGTYEIVNHRVGNHAIHKKTTLKVLNIPFFTYSSKPSVKDWKERILKNQEDVVFEV